MDEDTVLPASVADWQVLVEAMPHIVWLARPDGRHVHVNRRWTEFTGLPLEDGLEGGWGSTCHPDDRDRAESRWTRAIESGERYENELRLRRRDGAYRWMLAWALPLRDPSGAVVRWFGTCTDIDELKRARASLDQSRTLNRVAGQAARVGGWTIDVAANQVYWSEVMYEIYELPREVAVDLDDALDRYPPDDRGRLDAALQACIDEGVPFDLELELETYGGRPIWVRAIGEARRDAGGNVTQLFGALQDVTTQQEAARRTAELAEQLSTTLESITDGFLTLDREWRLTYVNGVAERLVRRRREELLGLDFWSAFPDLVGTAAEEAYERAMRDHVTVVLQDLHYPPLGAWFEVNIYPSEQGLAVYFRDVSDQHRARQALGERLKELQGHAAISRAAHSRTDARELAALAAESLATAMQEPQNMSVTVTLAEGAGEVGEVVPGSSVHSEPILVGTERLGSIVVRDATGEPLLPEEEGLIRAVAETLGLWIGRHRATTALREVNEQLNAANAQLAAAARFKDDLLSMASHELRTPLTPIIGFLEMFASQGDNLSEDQRRFVRIMRSNAKRMLRLVDDLLVVSRATAQVLASSPRDLSAQEVLAPVLEELGDALTDVRLSVQGCRLHVDPQHLQQIMINLLTNAAKYGEPPITVTARPARSGFVALEVADRGPGVSPDFEQRMWDRFEQKDRGDTRTAVGAGLGLSIVRLLTQANNGAVSYRDGTPSGAVFVVELPGHLD